MLDIVAKKCRYDIVRMISGAGSGHIGGALSSIDIYISILDVMDENDRLVISHGHSAAAVYAALGNMGYFDVEDAVKTFRRQAPYEGHPSIAVNGVEWCSGSLGQGLSVGCGFALAKKLQKEPGRVFVVMGDGEQQKGQLQEAREFASKYDLDNLIAVIDVNGLQACGETGKTTRQSLRDKYTMSGWEVVTADGHSFQDMKHVLKGTSSPLCILARTVMGKGIAEIENDYRYHGTVISEALKNSALKRLRLTTEEQKAIDGIKPRTQRVYDTPVSAYAPGRTYESTSDIRSAMGNALADIAKENPKVGIVAFDCDLEGSVKLTDFKKLRPDAFIECGIAEHNAATAVAAVAKSGMIAIHADFSMFNIAEDNISKDVGYIKFAGYGKYEVSAENPSIELSNPSSNNADFVFTVRDSKTQQLIGKTEKVPPGKFVYMNVMDFYKTPGVYDVDINISTYDSGTETQLNGVNQKMEITIK